MRIRIYLIASTQHRHPSARSELSSLPHTPRKGSHLEVQSSAEPMSMASLPMVLRFMMVSKALCSPSEVKGNRIVR
jgi:hypothetical protein